MRLKRSKFGKDRISMLLSSRQLFKNRERERGRKKTGFESEKRVEAQKEDVGWRMQHAFVEYSVLLGNKLEE